MNMRTEYILTNVVLAAIGIATLASLFFMAVYGPFTY